MIDCIHSIEGGGGGKDVKYGFETSLKHRRLVFVFRRLVRLIWFCETVELIKSVLSIFNDIWMIFAVMYGDKPHAQECIFQQSNLPKSNPFFIVQLLTHETWNCQTPEPLPFLPQPLEHLEALNMCMLLATLAHDYHMCKPLWWRNCSPQSN